MTIDSRKKNLEGELFSTQMRLTVLFAYETHLTDKSYFKIKNFRIHDTEYRDEKPQEGEGGEDFNARH